MTTGKTIALTRWTFLGKVTSLLFNMMSRLVITFLPRSKHLLISWLQSPPAVIVEPENIQYHRQTPEGARDCKKKKKREKPACACMLIRFSCVRLCNPMNCSLPGSSVYGILRARVLEWLAMPFSRGSSGLRDQHTL